MKSKIERLISRKTSADLPIATKVIDLRDHHGITITFSGENVTSQQGRLRAYVANLKEGINVNGNKEYVQYPRLKDQDGIYKNEISITNGVRFAFIEEYIPFIKFEIFIDGDGEFSAEVAIRPIEGWL